MNVTMKIKYRYIEYEEAGRFLPRWSKWIDGIPTKEEIKSAEKIQISRFIYNEQGREIGWDKGIVFEYGKKQQKID